MHLSRIKIVNFRNFSELDVELGGNVVVVGENRIGKSNLLYALRLIFDSTLSDSARQLGLSDFWDGLEELTTDDKIIISVEIKEFENDMDILAILTDYRLDDDPNTVRLTYEFRPRAELEVDPVTDDDFEFVCFGGENEAKRFGHELRRRITMDVLPALRDAEGDLANWRRSPLRPLVENAFKNVSRDDLQEISDAIEAATTKITEFEEVQTLEESIGELFAEMSGPKQDIKLRLGFSPSDPTRLCRNIRLLIDEGLRGINDASLGSANLVFLSLKALEVRQLIEENRRDYTFLAIEEPEAHLHPHLQRSVYRQIFESVHEDDDTKSPLSVFLTTHSPHIASVAPLRSILLLRDTADSGTKGCSTASIELTESEEKDLARYLDVTRAEILFSRGVILVEGDAERFLVPTFANNIGKPLDQLGITVCSVAGTNFHPYAKFLTGLGIPFSIITDWDPRTNGDPLGYSRTQKLIRMIEMLQSDTISDEVEAEVNGADYDVFCTFAEQYGIFLNDYTLEVDLFKDEFDQFIIETLREGEFGPTRRGWIDEWEADQDALDVKKFLSLIDAIGKGRFAQRLASRMGEMEPPAYISNAIKFVTDRV